MTALDDVRDWVGTAEPGDDAVNDALARFNDKTDPVPWAALAILRRRRADLSEGLRSIAVDGDVTEQYEPLRDRLALVESQIGTLETITGDIVTSGLPALTAAPIRSRQPCTRPLFHREVNP